MSIGKLLEKKIKTTNAFKEKQENHNIYLKQFKRNNSIEAYRRDREKLEEIKRSRKVTVIN
ncbi:hypothetical protein JUJ52_03420 [Virgibacillus sp. AGTR]|uniref:hypothetical protein n=1 Tax=Virgibacillus sp. AGTR TaxID=2812055 RepID=UPI001D16246E|nr:hypothetical protein [Virgibacillus sp. AGTR]MCC2249007.1 hypothetical protein [Virgibacillus sp. AGTR]